MSSLIKNTLILDTTFMLRVNFSVVPQSDGGGPSSQSSLRQISNISFKLENVSKSLTFFQFLDVLDHL